MIMWLLLAHLAGSNILIQPTIAFKNQDDCNAALQIMNEDHMGPPFLGECIAFAADKSNNTPSH